MTVSELIERLQALPPDHRVVVANTSRDEPDAFPLTRADIESYRPMVDGGVILAPDEAESGDSAVVVLYAD
ncbi:hypothetical protein [Saccharopolyspora sp. NPDC002376]